MSDTAIPPQPTAQPAPQPAAEKPKRGRSILNKKQEAEVLKSEDIINAAIRHAEQLSKRGITIEQAANLQTLCTTVRTAIGQTVGSTTGAAVAEAGLKDELVGDMRDVQAAAKQKFKTGRGAELKGYYVGEKIDSGRARVEQVSAAMLARLAPAANSGKKADELPGIDAKKIAALAAAREAYVNAGQAQMSAKTEAATGRINVVAQLKAIGDERRAIQYAAEGLWPATDPANAPIRREFQLPPDRAFNG